MINQIICGDCLSVLKGISDNSIDACVTDPPYNLVSIQKRFGKEGSAPAQFGKDGSFARLSKGFMGKTWDGTGITFNPDLWREVLRVLKPGGYLLSFGGSRTYHRMACAIEDAGFEIRDMIDWVYASGFPKSEDVSQAIDKKACREELTKTLGRKPTKEEFKKAWEGFRKVVGEKPYTNDRGMKGNKFAGGNYERIQCNITAPATPDAIKWSGWGTSLKPAHEPICVARKPIEGTVVENVLKYGVGGINIDGGRVEGKPRMTHKDGNFTGNSSKSAIFPMPNIRTTEPQGRFPANLILECICDEVIGGKSYKPKDTKRFQKTDGGNFMASPLDKTVAPDFDKDKKALIHTNPDCPCYMLDRQSGVVSAGHWSYKQAKDGGLLKLGLKNMEDKGYSEKGGASRFFYCAKASKSERNAGCEGMEEKEWERSGQCHQKEQMGGTGKPINKTGIPLPVKNNHPTVKPLSLMRYLINLVSRDNQIILDPFAGSGSTLIACKQLGRRYIGIEISSDYCAIANKRLENTARQGELDIP